MLRTFSKIYGLAGQRVGYAVGPERCIAAMTKVRRPFDLTTRRRSPRSHRSTRAGRSTRRRAVNAEGLARLAEILSEHGFDPAPAVGNFVYVETGSDVTELFDRLLHEGVIVRPLAGFGSPTAIRVSVGTPAELDEFASALGRVLARA